jgi:hypothetical protein
VVGRVRIITSLWRNGDDRTLPFFLIEWIKSSSRDCLESSWTGRIARLSGAPSPQEGTFSSRFAGSWDHVMKPVRSFQTVSRRTPVNKGQ